MQARLLASAKQPEVSALKACVLSSVLILLRQNNGPIIPFLQDDHKTISRRQKRVPLLIALDLLLPILLQLIHVSSVACTVNGDPQNRITSRVSLAFCCLA